MEAKDKKRDPLPSPDATPEEIGEFWDTHSLVDYLDETREVEFSVNLNSRQISTPNPSLETKNRNMSDDIKQNPSLPAEDISSDLLDTANELLLDSTIPKPIRKNVFKALDRLGSALIDIPVGALERRAAEKSAESEARIKITEALNAQIVEQLKVDPEFPQRASNTFAKKILREQYNLEKILNYASNILKGKKYDKTEQNIEDTSDNTIDDDWFNIFEKEACQKNSEDIQRRFARVLAGEIENPNSYSIKTLKTLGELDKETSELLKKLCSLSVSIGSPDDQHIIDIRVPTLGGLAANNALEKYSLGFSQLNILNEYSLIISDYDSLMDYKLCILDEKNPDCLSFKHQEKNWILIPSPEWNNKNEFRISGVSLSNVGTELFRIVEKDPIPEYTNGLIHYFQNQKLQMVEVPTPNPMITPVKPNE